MSPISEVFNVLKLLLVSIFVSFKTSMIVDCWILVVILHSGFIAFEFIFKLPNFSASSLRTLKTVSSSISS